MNNKNNVITDRFEISTGFRKENNLESKLQVGAAFKDTDQAYYKIRLMMFPGTTYYLVKNQQQIGSYTIFSRLTYDYALNKNKFLNPVGSGQLDSKLQSYLELRFTLLRTNLFMSLFPESLNTRKAA